MSTDVDRITLVIIRDDGTRDKSALRSYVGIPRKGELLWIEDKPYVVVEVEYAVGSGFFGGRAIEAAGVYVRRLTPDEQSAVARRLAAPTPDAEAPFRP